MSASPRPETYFNVSARTVEFWLPSLAHMLLTVLVLFQILPNQSDDDFLRIGNPWTVWC